MQAEAQFELNAQYGLHARPAAELVRVASTFQSEVFIEVDGKTANAKSVMNLLVLTAIKGSLLKVTAYGPDAQAAVEACVKLIQAYAEKENKENPF